MVITISEFGSLCKSDECKALHDRSTPLVAEPQETVYLGWVPVTWEDVQVSLSEADDWKEVDIVTATMSESEALTALRAVFGEHCEIEAR